METGNRKARDMEKLFVESADGFRLLTLLRSFATPRPVYGKSLRHGRQAAATGGAALAV